MNSQDSETVAEYINTLGAPICSCGQEASLRTSWTDTNPGRRFYGCRNYGSRRRNCNFFVWVDPEFPYQAKNVINGLLRRTEALEKEKAEILGRERSKKYGGGFCCCVAFLAVGIPLFACLLAIQKNV